MPASHSTCTWKIFSLALLVAAASGCAGAQHPSGFPEGENLIVAPPAPPEAWTSETFVKKQGAGAVLRRWVTNGGDDVFQVNISFGGGGADPVAFKEVSAEGELRKLCSSVTSEPTAPEVEAGYRTVTWLTDCQERAGRRVRRLQKAISGRDSFYLVQRIWRGEASDADVAEWRRRLSEARVCDTRHAAAPCPTDLVRAEAAAPPAPAAPPSQAPTFTLGGQGYVHRWSRDGLNEFTPPDQPDLARWTEMVSINLPPGGGDDASLERWAQAIRARYAASGRIVEARTVRTAGAEAGERLIAAELQAGGVSEVVVARLFVREGRPIGVVYSRRFSGDEAAARSAAWLIEHRAEVEANLLGWTGLPPLEALDRLPQSSR